jgi:precorrin-3B synthase
METGDGLLVRVHPPGGILTADRAHLIAETARAYGNGLLDVTARGNVQIRGVRETTYPALLGALDAAGLVEPDSDGPNRLTLLSPLAGIDPAERLDARHVADSIEAQASRVRDLPPKTFVAIDGGGLMPLNRVGADVILIPGREPGLAVLGLASPGGPTSIGATRIEDAAGAVLAILEAFAALRRTGRTEAGRIRDLAPSLRAELARAVALEPTDPPPERPPGLRAGLLPLQLPALLAALPFGRCSADQLDRAAADAARHGSGEIRPSPTRGLVLPGLAAPDVVVVMAREAGFIVDEGDPRLSISACPGAPSCASAATPAPADAARLAGAARRLIDEGFTLHISACPKGCAHPGAADLTLVGEKEGCYGLVPGGTARDPAATVLPLTEIMTLLATARSRSDLIGMLRKTRP